MPERIGFCFIRLHHSSLKRLAKKMSLNLREKTMKKIVLEEILSGILFFVTLAMVIVNMVLIVNLLDK